jgi:hypothetical protein
MKSVNLSELSEQELLKEAKKKKNLIIALWFLIGFMVVSALYKIYYQGFHISIFTPLCFVPILLSMQKAHKDIQNEIQLRKAQ